jgi:hypothetical protein
LRTLAVFWIGLALFACNPAAALAQSVTAAQDDKTKKSKQQNPPPPKEPQPLFGGKIPARSSQNTKESATLGFNGIDPSGKVNQKMLAANPSSGDVEKVRNMDATRPTPAEVTVFAKQGGLKAK